MKIKIREKKRTHLSSNSNTRHSSEASGVSTIFWGEAEGGAEDGQLAVIAAARARFQERAGRRGRVEKMRK